MLKLKAFLKGEEVMTKDGYEKHIYCEGTSQHVLSYDSNGVHCSEKNCVVNRGKGYPAGIDEVIFLD